VENEVETASPHDLQRLATTLGILADKEEALAGLAGHAGSSRRTRIAWQTPDGSRGAVEVDG